MSDLKTIILTSAVTVFTGFVALVVGEVARQFFLVPIQDQKKLRAKISYVVDYHRASYARAPDNDQHLKAINEDLNRASTELRQLAYDLTATLASVPFYNLLAYAGVLMDRKTVATIRHYLFNWQARLTVDRAVTCSNAIYKLLKFDSGTPDAQFLMANPIIPSIVASRSKGVSGSPSPTN